MTEGLQEVLKYGFESMGFNKVEAWVKPSDAASVLLLEKHGFREEQSPGVLFFKQYAWRLPGVWQTGRRLAIHFHYLS